MIVLYKVNPRPSLWSAVYAWQVTIFFWLGFYWAASYALRTVTFDRERRFAWLTLSSLMIPVTALAILVPPLSTTEIHPRVKAVTNPSQILYYYASFNFDSLDYTWYTLDFPEIWRHVTGVQRPTFFMLTAQTCRLIDIPISGYVSDYQGCRNVDVATIAIWP